jgi:hypothetical protein
VANTIAEKDFWVCWTLKRLFEHQTEDVPTLVFKGGTSLSKAFDAVRRFSEDIDLSIDRADLGYTGDRDPQQPDLGRKAADKLIDALAADVETYLRDKLRPALLKSFTAQLGEFGAAGWSLEIDPDDSQTLIFHYPTSLSDDDYAGMTYVTPRVKLEFGARGDPWPTEECMIQSYAAEEFPDFFEEPSCSVTVLSLARTFWEKVTALHAEAHRPQPHNTSRVTIMTSPCCSIQKRGRRLQRISISLPKSSNTRRFSFDLHGPVTTRQSPAA